jgi:hypothetical protein
MDNGVNPDGTVRNRYDQLGRQVCLAELSGWLTPSANDDAAGNPTGKMQRMLGHQAKEATSGQTATGSPVETGKSGVLSPAHSRWLMGYPPAWDDCGVTAMPSSRKSRQVS